MSVKLAPPPQRRSRERVLVYGVGGTGKSTAVVDLIGKIEGKVWVVDTEHAYDRMLDDIADSDGVAVNADNCDVFDTRSAAIVDNTTNWEATIKQVRNIVQTMQPDDWLAIDSITPTWDDVQAWYVEKLWGDDLASYMLAARMRAEEAGKKNSPAFEGFTDWPVINKQYNILYNLILNAPGHVILTAETQPLIEEPAETVATFGAHGVKPKGQKRLHHIPHTVLLFRRRNDGWVIDTVKDRNRAILQGEKNNGFVDTYLRKVAGWKPSAAWKKTS